MQSNVFLYPDERIFNRRTSREAHLLRQYTEKSPQNAVLFSRSDLWVSRFGTAGTVGITGYSLK
jgi:hypothetical protein